MPSPHTYRDFTQSPRLQEPVCKAPQAGADRTNNRASYLQGTAPPRTNEGGKSRKTVASEARIESQGFALLAALVVAFGLLLAGTAHARCRTHKCWHKVSIRRHVRYAWRYYRANPMPYCTWAYESGTFGSPWRASRYYAKNPSSTAGGKFQILDRTWFAYGGRFHGSDSGHHVAAYAPALEQEKIARRILAGQGIHAWSRC